MPLVNRSAPGGVQNDIRQGFVYERVPHISLKSIANNAEIDVIWDKWQAVLEPLTEKLNAAVKRQWPEWEIPREAEKAWPEPVKKLHTDWWEARIAPLPGQNAVLSRVRERHRLWRGNVAKRPTLL